MFKSKKRLLALAMTLVLAFSIATVSATSIEKGTAVDVFTPVSEEDENGFVNGSSVAELSDGSLLAVWSQGNGGPEGTTTCIMGSRLPEGETSWTKPFEVIDVFGVADMDPTLYIDSNGTLWMFWYPVMSATVETAQLRFAYAEAGGYEFNKIGNKAPHWDWSDTVPLKIGMISGDPVKPGTTKFRGLENGNYADKWVDDTFQIRINAGYQSLAGYLSEVEGAAEKLDERHTDVLQKIGGDASYQIFTPTVADKLWPKNGEVQRSGYPLLRRIGWQTKGAPIEITVKAGTLLSTGEAAEEATTRMILPLYSEGLGMSMMILTDDGGKTWMVSDPIIGDDNLQPVLLEGEDGVMAIMATGEDGFKQGKAQVAFSEDGYTWSDIARYSDSIPDCGNGLDATNIGDAQVIVTASENTLTVTLFDSEGVVLGTKSITGEESAVFNHPSLVVDADGDICITYTVNDGPNGNTVQFVAVDEAWIVET